MPSRSSSSGWRAWPGWPTSCRSISTYGPEQPVNGRSRLAFYALCGACALAAFATKENTAVLPITFLLYDLFFIQGISAVSAKRVLKLAVLPVAIVLVLGLIYTDFSLQRAIYESGVRPFSPLERLLTQGRVLFFYVSLLLYPIPSRLTFLHDIDISRSLFDPWTTLAAIVGIVLCLLFAAVKARRYPLLSFAILFFVLNHLIEGTVIPLELIFEHRNYIPSMFFFVPVAFAMVRCLDYFSYRAGFQFFMAAGFALFLAFQGHTTFERNDVVRSDVHLWLCFIAPLSTTSGRPPTSAAPTSTWQGITMRRGCTRRLPRIENRRGFEPGHQSEADRPRFLQPRGLLPLPGKGYRPGGATVYQGAGAIPGASLLDRGPGNDSPEKGGYRKGLGPDAGTRAPAPQ